MSKKAKEREAERAYRYYTKSIEGMIGRGMKGKRATFLTELDSIGHKIFGHKYHGTYSRNHVPRLTDLSPYCIINLDRSDEPGSHWVGVSKLKGKDEVLLYDSFGRNHRKILPGLSFGNGVTIKNTDLDVEQQHKETNCGQRSMAWLVVFEKYGPKIAKLI